MEILIGLVLLLLSALFSGLSIGLMSLDLSDLRRMAQHGNANAIRVLAIRKDSMLLLVTLLLGNATVNSIFTLYVGDRLTGAVAITLTTVLIFFFGEVLPQAVLTRHALSFGAKSAPLIHIVLRIFYPLCAPIAWALTRVLGNEVAQVYTKKEILSIVEETNGESGDVDHDEKRIVRGSLSYSERTVSEIMTPNSVVTTVEIDDVIDAQFLAKLKEIDYSRIPVFAEDEKHIAGMLLYKDLVGVPLPVPVRSIMKTPARFVRLTDSLDSVLNMFIKTKMHLFIVENALGEFEGVVTLEDIIEEIIGTEIMDESDDVADLRTVALQKKEALKILSQQSPTKR